MWEKCEEKPIKNVLLVEDSNSLEKVKSNLVALGRKENYLKNVRIASITRSKIQDDFFEIEIS